MAEFKLVISTKNGKSTQKIVKDQQAAVFLKKSIRDKIDGQEIGIPGYQFEITGGSDKCGFPMRKGILQSRQKITLQGSTVGFSGKNRNKKTQPGLKRKKTVCGEMITSSITQINLKVIKEGEQKLSAQPAPTEAAPAEEKAPAEKTEEKAPEKNQAEKTPPPEKTEDQPKKETKPEEKPEPKKEG